MTNEENECYCATRARARSTIDRILSTPEGEQGLRVVHENRVSPFVQDILSTFISFKDRTRKIYDSSFDICIPYNADKNTLLDTIELFPGTTPVDRTLVDLSAYEERMNYFKARDALLTKFQAGSLCAGFLGAFVGYGGAMSNYNPVTFSGGIVLATSVLTFLIALRKDNKNELKKKEDMVIQTHDAVLENARIADEYIDAYRTLQKGNELYVRLSSGGKNE